MSGRSSMPFDARSAAPSSGPASVAIQLRRAMTEASSAPKRKTLPRPSLIVTCARLPCARFSTANTGIEAVMIPVIGPTAFQ